MAEFPDLGQQCSQCNTLDFLPLICDFCKSIFCKEHHSVVSHNCLEFEKQSTISSSNNCVLHSILGKCCFCHNSVPDLELVLCDKCHNKHCLTHRHCDSHKCKKDKPNAKSEHILKKPILDSSAPKIKGPKNEGLARKVALMKLKQTACGLSSVPMTERLYFKISYQKSSQQNQFETKDIYLCKEWSIGKCVDWLATHLALTNNNNNPLAPKLVLSTDHQNSDSFSMSSFLKQLETEGVVQSGDKLCFKYIQ